MLKVTSIVPDDTMEKMGKWFSLWLLERTTDKKKKKGIVDSIVRDSKSKKITVKLLRVRKTLNLSHLPFYYKGILHM